jgi:Cys-tRNA(Pro)/Cys-tRNA(Cys) deacylase
MKGDRTLEEDRLTRFLRERAVDAEVIRPGQNTSTVQDAALALDVRPEQVVKSLLFQGNDDRVVLVVIRGTEQVDRRKLAAAAGLLKPRLASPATVQTITGYVPGATPPVGHATRIAVVVDRAVLDEDIVFGGGGQVDAMLRIRPIDIKELTGPQVADVAVEA